MEKIFLPNGVRVILEPDERAKTASVGVWVGSGTRFETAETAGISHFIEHMVFKGTKSRSAFDIAETMDSIGAQYNAYTTKQYTCFYVRALETYLETAASVIFDIVANPKLDSEDIETEKGVILEEIGMYEDSPEDVLSDSLYAGVWQSSMLGCNILGTRESVSSANAEQLRKYMCINYAPERTVISASGRFDKELLLKLIREYFGDLKNTDNPVSAQQAEYQNSIVLTEKDFEQTNLCICFPCISQTAPERYAVSVFNSILGGSSSSRLFQRIREKLGLAYSVGSSTARYMREGLLIVDMGVNPEKEEAALREATAVLQEICSSGVSEREFDRAIRQLTANVFMNSESFVARASHNGRSELLENTILSHEQIAQSLQNISIEEVNAAARQFIDFSRASISAVGKNLHDRSFYQSIIDAT